RTLFPDSPNRAASPFPPSPNRAASPFPPPHRQGRVRSERLSPCPWWVGSRQRIESALKLRVPQCLRVNSLSQLLFRAANQRLFPPARVEMKFIPLPSFNKRPHPLLPGRQAPYFLTSIEIFSILRSSNFSTTAAIVFEEMAGSATISVS